MAEILKLAQLVQDDGVAEVNVGRGRVEAELDASGTPVASDRASLASHSLSGISSLQ